MPVPGVGRSTGIVPLICSMAFLTIFPVSKRTSLIFSLSLYYRADPFFSLSYSEQIGYKFAAVHEIKDAFVLFDPFLLWIASTMSL